MSDEGDRHRVPKTARRHSLRIALVSPILLPAVALAGMWAYAADDSVESGLRLGAEAKAGSSAGRSVHTLVTRLQDERRLTAAWQSHRTKKAYAALEGARSRTDSAVTAFRAAEGKLDDLGAAAGGDKQRALKKELGDLAQERNQVDSRASGRGGSYGYYTGAAEAGTTFLAEVLHSDDGQLAHSAAAVTSLVQIGELLSREDALLTGAQTSGQMSATVRQTFLGHVAAQRQAARSMDTRGIPASAADDYRRIADQRQWAVVQRIEDSIATEARQSPARGTTPRTTPGTTRARRPAPLLPPPAVRPHAGSCPRGPASGAPRPTPSPATCATPPPPPSTAWPTRAPSGPTRPCSSRAPAPPLSWQCWG